MSATIVTSEAKAVPPVVSSVQDIPLEAIRESSSNPRRVFDEAQLGELAANIQLHGVLQAILVRPTQDGANGVYELVAGARRFRSSKLAGKRTIPATVRVLTDAEAQEIRLIENLQRTNIHELDEGVGYRSLIDLRPDFYTVETIAAQLAKSPSYVKGLCSGEHNPFYVVLRFMWSPEARAVKTGPFPRSRDHISSDCYIARRKSISGSPDATVCFLNSMVSHFSSARAFISRSISAYT